MIVVEQPRNARTMEIKMRLAGLLDQVNESALVCHEVSRRDPTALSFGANSRPDPANRALILTGQWPSVDPPRPRSTGDSMRLANGSLRRRAAILVPIVAVALLAAAQPTAARPPRAHGQAHGTSVLRAQVAAPHLNTAKPLPKKAGSVPIQRNRTVRPLVAKPPARALSATTTTSTAAPVQLRALVIAVDSDDWGVATWKATLDRVGAAYDVLYSKTTGLTSTTLVRPDAVGRYNAILLTSGMLLYFDSGLGYYVSGLDATEWNTLWAYERDYAVRQATLYTSYG